MFDMSRQDMIMKMIDERDDRCYVIPLYIHVNNNRYQLWELDEIENFSMSTLRIGFGSSRGLKIGKPLPGNCIYEFNMEQIFHEYNYDLDVDRFYYVFESGLLDDDELQDELHQQIQMYVNSIIEYLKESVDKKRKERIKSMLNNVDNYIDE